jgi:hypothetical protein
MFVEQFLAIIMSIVGVLIGLTICMVLALDISIFWWIPCIVGLILSAFIFINSNWER